LAGILLALLVLALAILVAVLLRGTTVAPATVGQTVEATAPTAVESHPAPKPIGDPDRIRSLLREGQTYQVVLKARLRAKVEDRAYSLKALVNLLYQGEFDFERTIESNDGRQIVELRRFLHCQTIKAESHVDELVFDWGPPGQLALGAWALADPQTGAMAIAAKRLAELGFHAAAQHAANQSMKGWAKTDSLAGKSVRITYVDGEGVTRIDPVDCDLTDEEKDFLHHTAVLADGYILPDVRVAPGKTWNVSGQHLATFLDPSLRGVTSGNVILQRERAANSAGGQETALLKIGQGAIYIDSSDASQERIGSLRPSGEITFDLTNGYVRQAELSGQMHVQQVSKDHLLFETSFRSSPELEIQYSCRMK
jgi:hypothetical protein